MRALWLPMAAMCLTTLLAGCVMPPKPLYFWGNYQSVLYQINAQPGSIDAQGAIEKLSRNISRAQAKGLKVPPGEHAELGSLQYQAGNRAQAATQFQIEKRLYPRSSVLMNRLLAKVLAGGGANS